LGQTDGCGSDWVFDVFAKDDSGTEGGGLPPLKRVRSSPFPLTAVENRSSPAAAVAAEGVEVLENAHGGRWTRGDKEYDVHQIVGKSELEYEVKAATGGRDAEQPSGRGLTSTAAPSKTWKRSWRVVGPQTKVT
jgi:hypothetical protein